MFQSTPPCGRRRSGLELRAAVPEVSIHASVREATRQPWVWGKPFMFQSTPPCGRRPAGISKTPSSKGFQSTPPCGRRPRGSCGNRGRHQVSIHASVREATVNSHSPLSSTSTFQSTPPCGRRLSPYVASFRTRLFQSTPPCGRRPARVEEELSVSPVSIHASVREATPVFAGGKGVSRRFNPRLRAGGDVNPSSAPPSTSCFNPRLRAGGDAAHSKSFSCK